MKMTKYIACDLGAESGRVVLGTIENGQLSLQEIHRFPTGAFAFGDSLRWNLPQIFLEIKSGVRKAAQIAPDAKSLSFDSWGVDYVLISQSEPMIGLPFHYRDARNEIAQHRVLELLGRDAIFSETGLQFLDFNTIYQLSAHQENQPELLRAADTFLTIADYLAWLFCGREAIEVSLASTTQLYNPQTRTWSDKLIEKLDLPRDIFPEIVASGTILGDVKPLIARELGLREDVRVLATCSHDTGAAVAAVPANNENGGENWAYLSSGTWSLLGVELENPIINDAVLAADFTNEIGYGHSVRFLKNIVGLWIVQECRRSWASENIEYSYDDLTQMARDADGFKSFIRPDDARFGKPDNMPAKIQDFCRETGQPIPQSVSEIVRCVLESLALLYGETLDVLRELTGKTIDTLHIVGGGSQNTLLNELASNATGLRVLAGPVEATAIGNIGIQAIALSHLENLDSLRHMVRGSFEVQEYAPSNESAWHHARERFASLEKD